MLASSAPLPVVLRNYAIDVSKPNSSLPCCRRGNQEQTLVRVLHETNLTLKPGTLTLMSGSPGSGKSMLISAIGGALLPSGASARGTVTYGGLETSDIASRGLDVRRLFVHVPESDAHEPYLTVAETLAFAWSASHDAASAARVKAAYGAALDAHGDVVGAIAARLGLSSVANVRVGALTRGERRMLTLAEAVLAGPRVLAVDSAVDGMLSGVAHAAILFMHDYARLSGAVVVAALPALLPSLTVAEFVSSGDSLLVLSWGRVVYDGAPGGVLDTFPMLQSSRSGHNRRGHGGGEVEDKDAAARALTALLDAADDPEGAAGMTSEALAAAGRVMQQTGESGTVDSASKPATAWASDAAVIARYGRAATPRSPGALFALHVRRSFAAYARAPPMFVGKLSLALVIGLLLGSLSYRPAVAASLSPKLAISLYVILLLGSSTFGEFPLHANARAVVAKHAARGWYSGAPFAVSLLLVTLPIAAIGAAVFTAFVFPMLGFDASSPSNGAFYWAIALGCDAALGSLFRFLVYATHSAAIAQGLGGVIILLFMFTSGTMVLTSHLPNSMQPAHWAGTFTWSLRAMVSSELASPQFDTLVPIPGTVGPQFERLGDYLAWSIDLDTSLALRYGALGLLTAYVLVFGVAGIALVAARQGRPPRPAPSVARLREAADEYAAGRRAHESFQEPAPGETAPASKNAADTVVQHDPKSDEEAHVQPVVVIASSLAHQVQHPPAAAQPPTPPRRVDLVAYELTYAPLPSPALPILGGISFVLPAGSVRGVLCAEPAIRAALTARLAGLPLARAAAAGGTVLLDRAAACAAQLRTVVAVVERGGVPAASSAYNLGMTLWFEGRLRFPGGGSDVLLTAHVEYVLAVTSLSAVKTVQLADLTPAEAARAAVAIELMADPSILLIEAAFEGLPPGGARALARVVSALASEGRSVILLHAARPPPVALACMTSVLSLTRTGGVGYDGLVGGGDGAAVAAHLAGLVGLLPTQRLPPVIRRADTSLASRASSAASASQRAAVGAGGDDAALVPVDDNFADPDGYDNEPGAFGTEEGIFGGFILLDGVFRRIFPEGPLPPLIDEVQKPGSLGATIFSVHPRMATSRNVAAPTLAATGALPVAQHAAMLLSAITESGQKGGPSSALEEGGDDVEVADSAVVAQSSAALTPPTAAAVAASALTEPSPLALAAAAIAVFRASPAGVAAAAAVAAAMEPAAGIAPHPRSPAHRRASVVRRFVTVMRRTIGESIVDNANIARVMATLFITIFLGLLANGIDVDADFKGAAVLSSLSYGVSVFGAVISLTVGLPAAVSKRPAAYRDAAHDACAPAFARPIAATAAEFCWAAGLGAVWSFLPFAIAGLPSVPLADGAAAWAATSLAILSATTAVQFYASLSPTPSGAGALQGVTTLLSTLLAGSFIPAPNLPAGWHWVCDSLATAYAFRATSAAHFHCSGIPGPAPASSPMCGLVLYPVSGTFVPLTPEYVISAKYGWAWASLAVYIGDAAAIAGAFVGAAWLAAALLHWARPRV